MKLEICAATLQSAINASEAGAHRIELCKDLHLDGLTPEPAIVEQVLSKVEIPVFVLIRPRTGDFFYSEDEFSQMLKSIDHARKAGADGIVSGILNQDNTLDTERTSELISRSAPMSFTFHRAFDRIPDKGLALKTLSDLGVERILTSAGSPTAMQGLNGLVELQHQAGEDLIVLPGGGITPDQLGLFRKNGFSEIHTSARKHTSNSKGTTHSDVDIIKAFLAGIQP